MQLLVNTHSVVQEITYSPFGKVLSDSSPGWQPFAFAGGHYDYQTGLVRFGARDYDAEVGRWTAKDPIGFDGGTNHYLYASGDPVGRSDLTGLVDEAVQKLIDYYRHVAETDAQAQQLASQDRKAEPNNEELAAADRYLFAYSLGCSEFYPGLLVPVFAADYASKVALDAIGFPFIDMAASYPEFRPGTVRRLVRGPNNSPPSLMQLEARIQGAIDAYNDSASYSCNTRCGGE